VEAGKGRPCLPGEAGIRFSFSSCRSGLLGAWSSTHGIGVDLEDPTRVLEARELARRYFTPAEARAVESAAGREGLHTFYRLWCLKEAALKSIGEGLPFGLAAFEFALDPAPRVVRAPPAHGAPGRFGAFLTGEGGGCAALVLRNRGRARSE
jgi:4'-phosphopantetheinyl transferase